MLKPLGKSAKHKIKAGNRKTSFERKETGGKAGTSSNQRLENN